MNQRWLELTAISDRRQNSATQLRAVPSLGHIITFVVCFCSGIYIATAGNLLISTRVLDDVERRGGSLARQKVIEWQNLMTESRNDSDLQKLKRVNDFFNQHVRFVDDIIHWRKKDYWATPLETLSTGAGDCEDFSIAKYFTLRELGVPIDKMRITFVKALDLGQAHMVLGYYPKPGADPLILDNLIADIRPGSRRKDLKPAYSFNGDGLWLAASRGQGKRAGSTNRIGYWRDLALRMDQEHAR